MTTTSKSVCSVSAVVVSYNRCMLLAEVLRSVNDQSHPISKIIVVDNGSSDGTIEMIKRDFPQAFLVRPETNLGGAGGFARGMSWALAFGTDAIWLMDDDAVPSHTCASQLVNALNSFPLAPFACPRVLDAEGNTGPRNYPVPHVDSIPDLYSAVQRRTIPATTCSFVGPMIRAESAKSTHAPLEDFFIWHDDYEYTTRLTLAAPGVCPVDATITHFAHNPGPKFYVGDRNYYNVRNMLWWLRESKALPTKFRLKILRSLILTLRSQFNLAPSKQDVTRVFIRALLDACRKKPRHRPLRDIRRESERDDLLEVGSGP